MKLLTRTEFREAVLARDNNQCVVCGKADALDAHHIIERRLFPDGGYYLDNGATLCQARCHLLAEQTVLSCEDVREAAGITTVVLPPDMYSDQRYDKWGNPIIEVDGQEQRLRGPLMTDASVVKVLTQGGKLSLFSWRVKYPRTWHLPWSPGATSDDRVWADDSAFYQPTNIWDYTDAEEVMEGAPIEPAPVVATLKMDGENCTWYRDGLHARSLEYAPHPSRNRVKALWAERCADIPEGWRVCGENLFARHSIGYDNLESYFYLFSVWTEQNVCLSWDETLEWAQLLNLVTVPVLYHGPYDRKAIAAAFQHVSSGQEQEGYVVRLARAFEYRDFPRSIAKYVRANHVQTHGHWMRQVLTPNKLVHDAR